MLVLILVSSSYHFTDLRFKYSAFYMYCLDGDCGLNVASHCPALHPQ